MLQDVLPSTRRVVESAKYVSINRTALGEFCGSFSPGDVEIIELGRRLQTWDVRQAIGLVCVFNCVNFCFWAPKGKPKWAVQIDGEMIDGASGMFCALEEALVNGVPLLDARFLSEMTQDQLGRLLSGTTEVPLLNERVRGLQEAGEVLLKHFDGSFMDVVKLAQGDAAELTNIFIRFFPLFNDFTVIDGSKIEFYKRAQLTVDMVNYRLMKLGAGELWSLDKLTAFADYKVPQILREFGILEYAPPLAERVDSYIEIDADSREEAEIRSATIWAIEEIKETLIPRYPRITARQLDDYLWSAAQKESPDRKPYHRTRTIFY